MANKPKPPNPQEYIALSKIRLWAGNYNEGDVGAITHMIRRFGFNRAVSLWRDHECRAGNHSIMALREIQATGPASDKETYPPSHVVVYGDEWFVKYIDVSYLDPIEANAYAIADNKAAALASANDEALYRYLVEISEQDQTLFTVTGYDADELTSMLEGFTGDLFSGHDPEDDSETADPSDGTLLKLVKIAIDEPKFKVERGEIYTLGDRHVLCCCNLMLEWGTWAVYLKGEAVFCPLPGPYAALGLIADERPLVMVQPDPYIAGHILTQYQNIHGEGSIKKHA